MKIEINKHNSICINNDIYIDPLDLEKEGRAKFIFFTHPHWDHFSIKDINKILTKNTILICPKTMEQDIAEFANKKVLVEIEKSYHLKNIEFETFRSYNIDKIFHPKENNWVGYNIKLDAQKIAVIGDSDVTPEIKKIRTDILLIPIGGTYTMNVEEAADLTNLLRPQKVIPTHYGEIVGNKTMALEFMKKIDSNIECEILI